MANLIPIEEKRIFLITTSDEKRRNNLAEFIQTHIQKSQIFEAHNGNEALFKASNTPPHICIIDIDLPKFTAQQLIQSMIQETKNKNMAFIVLSQIPEEEMLVDMVITGQVQFIHRSDNGDSSLKIINKALNYVATGEHNEYHIRFISEGETLIREGDPSDCVYILKGGQMAAFKNSETDEVLLGYINEGEFVGEMARFTNENRSATVKALTDCELIEIPDDTLDKVLFSKPSWTKALFQTLSRRLQQSNARIAAEKQD
tara:strand:- start:59384 stop:60160 length:777 start_codon:yes stop_codon:yes gene_type:complete